MKIFKVILLLALLFSLSFGVLGQTQGGMNWDPDYEYWTTFEGVPEDFIVIEKSKLEPDTLLGWFKNLTLEGKVEIYNWWKNDSVVWKQNCIEMPLTIADPEDFIFHFNSKKFKEGE